MHTAEAVVNQCALALPEIEPRQVGEPVLSWLYRVATRAEIKPSYAKRLHNREVTMVPAHTADRLRDLAAKTKAARERIAALRIENDQMLAAYRAGAPVAVRSVRIGGGLDAAASTDAADDARQLSLPLSGWRK